MCWIDMMVDLGGHDVIKMLNFSAIQSKFNHCLNQIASIGNNIVTLNTFPYPLGFKVDPRNFEKSKRILFYKNIVFQIRVKS